MAAAAIEEQRTEDIAFALLAAVLKDLDRSTRSDVVALLTYGEPGAAIESLLFAIEGGLLAPAEIVEAARGAVA
ncbi:MAG TPA: hypothetical protein GXZ30_04625 [Propionibacterium sp.]|jgi:hypothetical protein|nr:hypothetical protein [Propionibacterium sp.]